MLILLVVVVVVVVVVAVAVVVVVLVVVVLILLPLHVATGRLHDYSKYTVIKTELTQKTVDFDTLKFEVEGSKVAAKLGVQRKVPYIQV